MAVNKRKVLDAARKYAQKGAKEKALKEYHTLLKLDPRDAKLHLEIGDCYRRWGQIDEAITQYARVAEQYKDDGFDARAVAVFKQILNLDPKRYTAYVSLSELYQRMGLDSEALTALQSAADGHHKEGNKREALELLRKMATLDPTNTTSRLKVAELLRQEGLEGEAVSEYQAVVQELERQGATESIIAVEERILELEPGRTDVVLSIARRLIELQKPGRAEPFAKQVLEKDPEDADAYEVLVEVYKALGNDEELAKTTRTLAKIFRDRGDDDRARELTQRIPLALELEAEDAARGPAEETDSAFLSDDELLDDDFLAADVSEELPLEDDELELEIAPPEESFAEPVESLLDDAPESGFSGDAGLEEDDDADEDETPDEPKAALPEGDPDQLLAEASVYLRYGKREQAIASLEAILVQEPEHRAALEKLGDAFADGGDDDKAVELWSRAAARARVEGDEDGFSVLHDRIAALDADAASALERAEPGSVVDEEPEEPLADVEDGIDFEIDLDVGTADDAARDDDSDFEIDVSVGDAAAEVEAEVEDSIEIDLSTDDADEFGAPGDDLGVDGVEFETEDPAEPDSEGLHEDGEDDDEASTSGVDLEIDVDVDLGDEEADEQEACEDEDVSASAGAGSSTTTSQQVSEDLEEAEFYFQQSLFDEAEAVYRRILEIAPNHPSALLRLGELAAQKGDDPSGLRQDGEAIDSTPAVARLGEDSTEVADLSLDDDDEQEEPAVQLDVPPSYSRADDTLPFDEDVEEPEADDTVEEEAEDDEGGGFDLAAELRDAIEDDDGAESTDSRNRSTVEDGFESIFADFKQGVSATLSEDDYETRYDLGIAYREMELYDDAIGEFRMCLDSPSRKLESLHLMALCAIDLGRAQDAANHLEQALATPDLPEEQIAGLHFDLGRALEVAGDADRARSAYEAVLAADPDFPGVAQRLESLGEGGDVLSQVELHEEAGGGFESFDDLVAEAQEDDDTTEQTESFESFDDVITEAESAFSADEEVEDDTSEEAESERTPEPEEAPEPEPEAANAKGKKKSRKKKISFV